MGWYWIFLFLLVLEIANFVRATPQFENSFIWCIRKFTFIACFFFFFFTIKSGLFQYDEEVHYPSFCSCLSSFVNIITQIFRINIWICTWRNKQLIILAIRRTTHFIIDHLRYMCRALFRYTLLFDSTS